MYTIEELLEMGMDELEQLYGESAGDYDSVEDLMESNGLIF